MKQTRFKIVALVDGDGREVWRLRWRRGCSGDG